jgi:hypothetical protein
MEKMPRELECCLAQDGVRGCLVAKGLPCSEREGLPREIGCCPTQKRGGGVASSARGLPCSKNNEIKRNKIE